MKFLFGFLSLFLSLSLFSQTKSISRTTVSPLASYSEEWNDAKYAQCNTAADANYMNEEEKKIIYVLNLVRINPKLFAETVLKKYPAMSGKTYLLKDKYYYQSLMNTLLTLEPKNILYPDKACYSSAQCHASTSGADGYLGHERRNKDCKKKKYYYGECCEYGHTEALDIVLALLIDEKVPSLGHREICLNIYTKVGVSMQPHSRFRINTVLDFYY